jgi:hypothetical protein
MNNVPRILFISLVTAVIGASAGCAHKPAYSDMDTSKSSRNQNQNNNQSADGQASAPTPAAEQPAADVAPPAPAIAAANRPSFLDEAKGEIKDLPSYPNAYRVNLRVGPIQGVNTMSLGFTTTDPMDKISAFFERVIRENKWTVSDKIIDPELSEWTLAKGADNSAKVQVKKDQRTGAMTIVMVRGEKLEAATKK